MRAVVLRSPGSTAHVEDVHIAAPRRGEVKVRLVAAGLCGTDIHALEGDLPLPVPCVMGHEGAGVVEDVGPDVDGLCAGDHVILLWRASCGKCMYCCTGHPALCHLGLQIRQTGALLDGETRFRDAAGERIHHFLGASTFSQYTVAPVEGVVKIDKDIPLDRAALLGCGVLSGIGAAVNAARVEPGSSVAVFGAGGIGLNVIQGARLAGAATIIAIDTRSTKLALARSFGASHCIDASTSNPVAAILEMTAGQGVDYAIEAVGLPSTCEQALACTRKAGMVVMVGLAPPNAAARVNLLPFVQSEKTLRGCLYGSSRPRVDIPRLLDLYRAGRLMLDELITQRFPLEDFSSALDALRTGEVARALLLP